METFFNDILRREPSYIQGVASDLCEARSRYMVERTFSALDGERIIYLEIGALHTYGVREALRARGVGYLVLSP